MKAQTMGERLLKQLAGHSIVKAIQVEEDAKLELERQAHIDAIAALEAQRERELPPLLETMRNAEQALKAARLALREAEQNARVARAAVRGRAVQLEVNNTFHAQALDATADERIGQFIVEMRDRKPRLRSAVWSAEVPGKMNLATGKRETVFRSNNAEIVAALAAIDSAISAAEGLKREASAAGLDEKLEALRRSIPKVPGEPGAQSRLSLA